MEINLIACIDQNGGLGYQNKLLFHIPNDMKRFRTLTTGHTIIMGRKTYESLPHGALPNRRNIVVSHQDLQLPHCEIYHSIEEALEACKDDKVFIIGGASLYQQTLSLANKLYLTQVEETCQADVFFPRINKKEWNICESVDFSETDEDTNKTYHYSFLIFEKSTKCPF